MNLMIVEDELQLLNSLANSIPWDENDIKVIATASNGAEAVQLFEQLKPDIILMDIQMPELDGLEVAKYIYNRDKMCKVILLSGHDDFNYAQKAVEYGVMKYLLKPAGIDEILQTVLEMKDLVVKEREKQFKTELLQARWEEHLPQIQNAFFRNWLHGHYDEWEINRRSSDLLLDFSNVAKYGVVVVDLDPLNDEETRFTKQDTSLLYFSIHQIAKEYLERSPCYVISDNDDATVLLFIGGAEIEAKEFFEEIQVLSSRLVENIQNYLKVSASAGIGKLYFTPKDVTLSYQQARNALLERVIYGNQLVIPYQEDVDVETGIKIDVALEKRLIHSLEIGNEELAVSVINEFIKQYIEKASSVEVMWEHALYFSSLFVKVIYSQGWSLPQVVGDHYVYFQNIHLLTTKDKNVQWLLSTVRSIAYFAKQRSEKKRNELVDSMIEYIEQNIHADITLHECSQKLFMNSSYLSRLFKQNTNRSFSQYVLEMKMKLAMERLNKGSKVIETANALGYNDVSYFTKVFRKYWGMTPGEVN